MSFEWDHDYLDGICKSDFEPEMKVALAVISQAVLDYRLYRFEMKKILKCKRLIKQNKKSPWHSNLVNDKLKTYESARDFLFMDRKEHCLLTWLVKCHIPLDVEVIRDKANVRMTRAEYDRRYTLQENKEEKDANKGNQRRYNTAKRFAVC